MKLIVSGTDRGDHTAIDQKQRFRTDHRHIRSQRCGVLLERKHLSVPIPLDYRFFDLSAVDFAAGDEYLRVIPAGNITSVVSVDITILI